MKKAEITIVLEFDEDVNIDLFIENQLNSVTLRNCGASTIRIRKQKEKVIVDFYDVESKRKVLRYKKLLLQIANCINSIVRIENAEKDLLTQFKGMISDRLGMIKQFEDLQNCYKKLTNYE